jgi:hypothetical protein
MKVVNNFFLFYFFGNFTGGKAWNLIPNIVLRFWWWFCRTKISAHMPWRQVKYLVILSNNTW